MTHVVAMFINTPSKMLALTRNIHRIIVLKKQSASVSRTRSAMINHAALKPEMHSKQPQMQCAKTQTFPVRGHFAMAAIPPVCRTRPKSTLGMHDVSMGVITDQDIMNTTNKLIVRPTALLSTVSATKHCAPSRRSRDALPLPIHAAATATSPLPLLPTLPPVKMRPLLQPLCQPQALLQPCKLPPCCWCLR